MKCNLFSMDAERYRRRWVHQIVFLSALGVLCLAGNLVLLFTVTEKTRLLFLIVNICTDILVFGFIYYWSMTALAEMHRKLRLYERRKAMGECLCGVVSAIRSGGRVEKFDCRRIVFWVGEQTRVLFAVEGTMEDVLREGAAVRLVAVNNIVVEAEDGTEEQESSSL